MKAYHKNTKHLGHKPPVARNPRPVLHELALCPLYVVDHIFCVGVYPLDLFAATISAYSSTLCQRYTNPCSDTIAASCPKTPPSSLIVRSIMSIASPRIFMYVFCGCASSIIKSCWSDCAPFCISAEAEPGSRFSMS